MQNLLSQLNSSISAVTTTVNTTAATLVDAVQAPFRGKKQLKKVHTEHLTVTLNSISGCCCWLLSMMVLIAIAFILYKKCPKPVEAPTP